MSDSNITKKALAAALRTLMETESFSKISVGDICALCQMNRKSFYYHFRDKYDLANWIYQTEFISAVQEKEYGGSWDFIQDICDYFYKNRAFYSKLFQVQGQNSFASYFREMLVLVFRNSARDIFSDSEALDFFAVFFADAFVSAFSRWLIERPCRPPSAFVPMLRLSLEGAVEEIRRRNDGQTKN